MPTEVLVYLAIFLVILVIGFKILKNLKVILMIAIAGFFAYYVTNYAVKGKDLSGANVSKKFDQTADAIVEFEGFINQWTENGLKNGEAAEQQLLHEIHLKNIKRLEETKEYQKKLAKEQHEQYMKDIAIINVAKNAKF